MASLFQGGLSVGHGVCAHARFEFSGLYAGVGKIVHKEAADTIGMSHLLALRSNRLYMRT
jgi:hypothetical protein